MIRLLNNLPENWDILMLSLNTISDTHFSDTCNNAQTASVYIVSKKFAPTLLQNFESNFSVGNDYCIYVVATPIKLVYQMESYSDISKFVVV